MDLITTTSDLAAACSRLAQHKVITVDTEFLRETTYYPLLCVVQMASAEEAVVIDTLAPGIDLKPFFELMANEAVLKVFHAARQDIEIVWHQSGTIPHPIFDTQVAAAMLGYGHQIGYGQLVSQVVGVVLEKSETFTNWAQRPLTPQQLEYAVEDVRHLFTLHSRLHDRLKSLGRLEWVEEEFRRLQVSTGEESRSPQIRYQKIRGWEGLKPRARAVLRELAAWREQEAQKRDRPRGRVLRDDVLLEIARRMPASTQALGALRGFQPSQLERYGDAIVATIQRGLAVPEGDFPRAEKRPRIDPETAGLADLLGTALKVRAIEASISPQLLASSADLEIFALEQGLGAAENLPILQGWRRTLAGEHLLKVLEGKITLGYDPETGQVRLFER